MSAGDPISFTIDWGNAGEGKATGVVVSDDLPGKAGLDWSIDSFTGTGSSCGISGATGSQVLTCDVGPIPGNTATSGSVTVVSGHDQGVVREDRQHGRHHVGERRQRLVERGRHGPVPRHQGRQEPRRGR